MKNKKAKTEGKRHKVTVEGAPALTPVKSALSALRTVVAFLINAFNPFMLRRTYIAHIEEIKAEVNKFKAGERKKYLMLARRFDVAAVIRDEKRIVLYATIPDGVYREMTANEFAPMAATIAEAIKGKLLFEHKTFLATGGDSPGVMQGEPPLGYQAEKYLEDKEDFAPLAPAPRKRKKPAAAVQNQPGMEAADAN